MIKITNKKILLLNYFILCKLIIEQKIINLVGMNKSLKLYKESIYIFWFVYKINYHYFILLLLIYTII